jgi:hypothetical protein
LVKRKLWPYQLQARKSGECWDLLGRRQPVDLRAVGQGDLDGDLVAPDRSELNESGEERIVRAAAAQDVAHGRQESAHGAH